MDPDLLQPLVNMPELPQRVDSAMALHLTSGSLSGKLRAIWEGSKQMVRRAERDRLQAIRAGWKGHWQEIAASDSMRMRARVAVQHGLLKRPPDQLLAAYFGAIGDIDNTSTRFRHVIQGETAKCHIEAAYGPSRLNREIWNDDHLTIAPYLNEVVPCFFSLQLHCYDLVRILDGAVGIPLDGRNRKVRAQAGGKASAHGKEYFKEKVLARLKERSPVPPRLTVPKFVEADPLDLASVLAAYQDDVDKGVVWKDETLAWGRGVTMHSGVKSALNEWSKEDANFFSALKRHCEVLVAPVEE